MTCGIYQLEFGANHFYIGKSINIEERFLQHMKKLNSGTAAKPMQACFNDHGAPSQKILIQCHPDHLDVLEPLFIDMHYNSAYCLNSDKPTVHHRQDLNINSEVYRLLQMSTLEHIEEINQLRNKVELEKTKGRKELKDCQDLKNKEIQQLKSLPDIVEALATKEAFNIQASRIQQLTLELSHTKEKHDNILRLFNREKSKTWWTKLWE